MSDKKIQLKILGHRKKFILEFNSIIFFFNIINELFISIHTIKILKERVNN